MTNPVPFVFALGGDASETLEWLTDIGQAPATGVEHRRRLRSSPRVTLRSDGLQEGQLRRWLENSLHAYGTGPWEFPLLGDTMVMDADASIGSTILHGDASLLRFAAGGRALICTGNPRVAEIVSVETFGSTGIMLSGGTARAWPAGTVVRPMYAGRFDSMPQLARFTGDSVSYSVECRLDEVMDVDFTHGLPMYRGYPVLESFVDWTSDPEWTPARLTTIEDEDTGPVFVNDAPGVAMPEVTLQLAASSRVQVASLLGLLWTMCGRWQPIWVPSKTLDLVLAANASSGALELVTEWSGLADAGLAEHRKDIRIELHDGSVIYRRITAVEELSDAQELLALDHQLDVAFRVQDVAAISFMALMRQDADVNRLNWFDHQTLQTEMTLKAVPHGI
ncbi:hypothetical protein NB688_000589 [Xanthomonas sacchari]|uniref:Phage tail protein n=1 Tax=Xanthomonas sacchari TaxID=56458 RepID=A0ABT3DTF0_9XANT|nr:hypothetical protein [Xanthomonas sacchari]MCW0398775.1 hypothetical protein [Xanthomonas sacchari]MCW0418423.1 hypothetical protein [Xanthomonas sacchari]UYK72514.1 hypothetical protein NG828_20395 [Xanthomonas sacchari]